jgi:hypothetical protein
MMRWGIKILHTASPARIHKDQQALVDELYRHNAHLMQENEELKAECARLRKLLYPGAYEEHRLTATLVQPKEQPTADDLETFLTKELAELTAYDEKRMGKQPAVRICDSSDSEYASLLCEQNTVGANEPTTTIGRRLTNRLYNVVVRFEVTKSNGELGYFSVNAAIDTGCTCCCINQSSVPDWAHEPSLSTSEFHGVNSKQRATRRLKPGRMFVGGSSFKTPYTYCFNMNMPGIAMLIGCNFIRSMGGGVRLEGMEVTFYKNITRIQTTLEPEKLAMLQEVQTETRDFWALQDQAYQLQIGDPLQQKRFEETYMPLMKDLQAQGFIGENPQKHWALNGIKCKLDIIDPNRTIQCNPLKHVTPAMKDKFKAHINALLALGVIRPSSSRHRTNAIIVQSGTTMDPVTKKETKGKERMVYDYRILNDYQIFSFSEVNKYINNKCGRMRGGGGGFFYSMYLHASKKW